MKAVHGFFAIILALAVAGFVRTLAGDDAKGWVTVGFAAALAYVLFYHWQNVSAAHTELKAQCQADKYPSIASTEGLDQLALPDSIPFAAAKRLRTRFVGGNGSESAAKIASSLADEQSAKVSAPRVAAASAVYIGLAGTLVGLTFAVGGLRNLDSDTVNLKTQILTIVGGFGSAFISALAGVIVTLVLNWRINLYDDETEEFERILEDYLSEEILPVLAKSGGNVLAEAIVRGINDSLSFEVKKLREAYGSAIGAISEAVESMRATNAELGQSNAQLLASIATVGAAAGDAKSSAEENRAAALRLRIAAEKMTDVVEPLQATGSTMNEYLKKQSEALIALKPLLDNASQFSDALHTSASTIDQFVKSSDGTVQRIGDSLLASDSRIDDYLRTQTGQVKEVVQTFNDEVGRLRSLLHQYSEMLHAMPLSVPAAAIMADLNATITAAKDIQHRDVEKMEAAKSVIIDTERTLRETIERIESDFAELRREVDSAKTAATETRWQFGVLNETLSRPLWKKLLNRP